MFKLFLKTSDHFIKVFQKQKFHLTSTIYLYLWCWTEKRILLHLVFFVSNWDQALPLKVVYIFKVFGAQSCLMVA